MTEAAPSPKQAPSPKKKPIIIQYYQNGEPIPESQNKISSIAWWHTKGIKRPGPLSSAEFRALLEEKGIKDTNTVFDVTLPNGRRIHSTIGALVAPTPKVPKAPVSKAQARAEKVTKAAARIAAADAAKAEGEALLKWREGGEVGPKPPTPATDALKARLEARPSRGAQKAVGVSKALADAKATTTKKAAPRKSPAAKKTPAKKAPAKKVPAKKTAAKKVPARPATPTPRPSAGPKQFKGPIPKPSAAKKAAS